MADKPANRTQIRQQRRHRRALKTARAEGFMAGLVKLLGPEHICIDCGANVGDITLQLAETGAQVHAFEPDPLAFETLVAKVGGMKNVTCYQQAVGVKAGSVRLYKKPGYDGKITQSASTMADNKDMDATTAIDVECIKFEDFLRATLKRGNKLALLKLDIEGAELPLLEQLVQTDLLPQISATVVETHEWLLPNSKKRYNALRKIAQENPEMNLNLAWL